MHAQFRYLQDRAPFSLIQEDKTGFRFALEIYDRSDLERYVKDLDLPDVVKALKKINSKPIKSPAKATLEYLLETLERAGTSVSYKAGDIAMYNEKSTIRFSSAYTPSTPPEKDRWLISLSVK